MSAVKFFACLDFERKPSGSHAPHGNQKQTLQSYFGSSYVGQFVQSGLLWQVIIQARPEYRDALADMTQIYVQSNKGSIVPLSALAKVEYVAGANILPRFNGFTAAKLSGSQAPGFSTGQAIAAMERIAGEVLPEGYDFSWAGQANEEKKAGGTSSLAFIFGCVPMPPLPRGWRQQPAGHRHQGYWRDACFDNRHLFFCAALLCPA